MKSFLFRSQNEMKRLERKAGIGIAKMPKPFAANYNNLESETSQIKKILLISEQDFVVFILRQAQEDNEF